MREFLLVIVLFLALFLSEKTIFSQKLLVLPVQGDMIESEKERIRELIKEILVETNYNVITDELIRETLRAYNYELPLMGEEILHLGKLCNVEFILQAVVTPMVGQYQIEINWIKVETGEVKTISDIVIEEEERQKLKELLAQINRVGVKYIIKPEVEIEPSSISSMEKGEKEREKIEGQEFILPPPRLLPLRLFKKKPSIVEKYGNQKLTVGLSGALGINIGETPTGNRLNGHIFINSGYILKPEWLWFGVEGELGGMFGNASTFYLLGGLKIKYPPLDRLPLFTVFTLGCGFLRSFSASQRNSFILRIKLGVSYRIGRYWEVSCYPISFDTILGGGSPLGIFLVVFSTNYYF